MKISPRGGFKMAKKRKKKYMTEQRKFEYHTEVNGFLLMLIAIIAFGPTGVQGYGVAGDVLSGLAVFLVGVHYMALIVICFLAGVYMIIRRSWPRVFSTKFLGLYLIAIGILILTHLTHAVSTMSITSVFNKSVDNFLGIVQGTSYTKGAGIIGGAVSVGFIKLFSVMGTKIISWAFISFGAIIFTGISIFDIVRNGFKRGQGFIAHQNKKIAQKIKAAEEEFEKESVHVNKFNEPVVEEENKGKVVISSLDELTENKQKEQETHAIKNSSTEGYVLPPLNLLSPSKKIDNKKNEEKIQENIKALERVFLDFDIIAEVVKVNIGPAITQYEMKLKAGTKVSKVLGIYKEISLALAARSIRIEAPIPGKRTIGVEVPNESVAPVALYDILTNISSSRDNSKLVFALGKNIMGRPIFDEINKMPHLLVAGQTGSGKSVCINGIVCSLLMRARPDEVKLLMIDPKKVELSIYNGIPHLLAPVVTNPKKASLALKRIVTEMEHRYEIFEQSKTKNIAGYNAYVESVNQNNSEKLPTLPYIVVVIDELSDLMAVASKEVEESIMRITQMARAAGIHLIVATQRPSTDVITGLIKSNLTSRIAFAVSSSIDSRTILDSKGAEALLGKGDMLFSPAGESAPIRVQGAFISDEEVKKIVNYVSKQGEPTFDESLMNLEENKTENFNTQDEEYEEPLYNEMVEFVVTSQKASASLIQRRFRVGYNRAARVIDLLEERGIIGPANGSKPREVLVKLNGEEK